MKKEMFTKLFVFAMICVGFVMVVVYYSNALTLPDRYRPSHYKYDSSTTYYDGEKIEKTFSVNPGGLLKVNTDFANIKVESWDKNEVYVLVEKEGDSERLKDYIVSFSSTPDRVEVYGENNEHSWNWGNFHVRITVKVPSKYNCDINSSAGNIDVKELTGNVKVNTSAGNLLVNSINGDVDIESSAGNIDMDKISGQVKASTSAGNITLSLMNDNKGVDMETSAGNIKVYISDSVKANLKCSTSIGKVRLDVDKFGFSGSIDNTEINGKLNGGGNLLNLHTSIGNVRIAKKE